MVQESRSLLIQQLFQGGFKEDDDDDDDEDEAHEIMNSHPSNDKYQGSKEHSHQELIFGDWKARERNCEGSKDNATEKQVFDNNVVNKRKLLDNNKPWKDSQTELYSVEGDCLQLEKEIVEESNKKLLQIHNKFLIHQHNPPLQSIKEPAQQELETLKDSNCFSNDCHKPQQYLKGGENLNSSFNFPTSKLTINNKEKNSLVVLKEAQQSYGLVEDALLSTQRDFTSVVSLEEEERRQCCFAVLNNAKKAARELNANISIPVFSTRFEKKSSISECTKSLSNDQGSNTSSTNSGNEVIHNVMSMEKNFIINEQKGDQVTTEERSIAEASIPISKVEEVVQQIESIVPVIQMETTQSEKTWRSKTTDRIKDWQIETIVKYRQAKDEKPFSHVFEENHVEFIRKVQETEPTSLINAGRDEQKDEPGTFKLDKDIIDARDKLIGDVKETLLIEMPLKQCANATSLEEANGGDNSIVAGNSNKEKDKPFVISSPMDSPKELLVDVAHHNTIYSLGKENKLVSFTSSKEKLPSLIGQTIESPLNEDSIHMNSSLQKMSTLQAFGRGLIVDLSKVDTTQTTTSPQVVEMPTMHVPPHTTATFVNKRSKLHEKARTSKMSKKKRVCMQHQDVKNMAPLHSDTRVAYNNGHHFTTNTNYNLPQEISQHYAITNIINPSFNDFVGSPQAIQAATFMSHKTNTHLMQVQASAKDAMLVATSTLAQSHCEQSQMKTHVATSCLKVVHESQIAAITASVAAIAVVAKVAMEAAKAIQEASKEFLSQLGGPSQPSFGKSRFASSTEAFVHGQGNISKMTNCQHVQVPSPSKINIARKIRKNLTIGTSSTTSKNELVNYRSRKQTMRFMKQAVVTDDKKIVGEGGCKKRTIHKMDQTQHVGFLPSSHVELRDLGCEVLRCTKEVSTGIEPNELVEVMTGEVGLQGGWFVAKVLMKTDMEAFVQYKELFRADGCTPFRNLFPLSSFRQEDAYEKIQQGDWRWLRPLHPFNKAWELSRGSMLPQTWTIGDHVDTYSNGGWWEGIVVEIDKADETNVRIHFSGGKGIQAVKAWDVRPSLIWAGDHWRPWKKISEVEVQDEPSSKRLKLNVRGNWKSNESIRKEKMQSLKKLVVGKSCKSISNGISGQRRVSCRSVAQKNGIGNKELNALNIRRVDLTPTNVGHKCKKMLRPLRSTRVVHLASSANLATSKKVATCSTPSPTLLTSRKETVSTRLQRKIEAEKHKKMSNMVVSKVIQEGAKSCAKSISTRSDTMKLTSKTIQTKLLNALKNTSSRKLPRLTQKVR